MDPQFIDWAFKILISAVALYASREFREMRKSIEKLNINVAVVIEKQSSHEKRLDGHDSEIKELKRS